MPSQTFNPPLIDGKTKPNILANKIALHTYFFMIATVNHEGQTSA